MTIQNIVIAGLVALALLLGYTLFTFKTADVAPPVGAASGAAHYQKESFLQGLAAGVRDQFSISNTGAVTIGSSGTSVANFLYGTCNLTQMVAGSQNASSTATFFCSATGVLASDKIEVDLPSGAGATYGGFIATNAYATTTGILAVTIANFSGIATSSFAQATTSIEYFDWR
jgi:hypothetical protein